MATDTTNFKHITFRLSKQQLDSLELLCKQNRIDRSSMVRLILDDWIGRKESNEDKMVLLFSEQFKKNKEILLALRTVFAATIATKEMAHWGEEGTVKTRKEALVLFDNTISKLISEDAQNV